MLGSLYFVMIRGFCVRLNFTDDGCYQQGKLGMISRYCHSPSNFSVENYCYGKNSHQVNFLVLVFISYNKLVRIYRGYTF